MWYCAPNGTNMYIRSTYAYLGQWTKLLPLSAYPFYWLFLNHSFITLSNYVFNLNKFILIYHFRFDSLVSYLIFARYTGSVIIQWERNIPVGPRSTW